MSIDRATTEKVATLARLRLQEDQKDAYTEKLNGIMNWIEQLQAVDTDGVEPLSKVHDIDTPVREDQITDGGIQDKVLSNAPETLEGFFGVPKIIE